MKRTILFLLTLASTLLAHAQNPGIPYQATLLAPETQLPGANSGIIPLKNTDVCLRFTFKNASGTEYQETQTATTSEFGRIDLVIGYGTPTLGSFNGINWDGNQKTMEVDIDYRGLCANFEPLAINEFQYVPYAFFALNAGGGSTTTISTTTDPSIPGNLTINGNPLTINVDDNDNDPTNEIELPATAALNQVLTWDGSAWVARNNPVDADSDPANEIQDLEGVLTQNNDAGGLAITNLLDPTNAQDAATKAYVDAINFQLVNNSDGTFTFTDKNGTATTFDSKISTVIDNTDGTYTITDDSGNTVTINSSYFADNTSILLNNTTNTFSLGVAQTANINDGAITAAKLDDMGATDGQVLKYDATNAVWEAQNDTDTNTTLNTATLSGTTLVLTDSDANSLSVDLNSIDTDTNTTLNTATLSGTTLVLTDSDANSLTVDLNSIDTDTNTTLNTATLSGTTLVLTDSDANSLSVDLNSIDTDTNTTLNTATLSGTTLVLTDSDANSLSVDLNSINTDTNTTLNTATLSGTTLVLTDSDANSLSVDLNSIDTDTNTTLNTATLSGTTLVLTDSDANSLSVDLNSIDTDTNTTLNTATLSGTTLVLTDSDANSLSVDLNSIDTDTNTTYRADGTTINLDGTNTFSLGLAETANINDGAITSAKINSMSATSGQVLYFNGTNWSPGELNDIKKSVAVIPSSLAFPSANPLELVTSSTDLSNRKLDVNTVDIIIMETSSGNSYIKLFALDSNSNGKIITVVESNNQNPVIQAQDSSGGLLTHSLFIQSLIENVDFSGPSKTVRDITNESVAFIWVWNSSTSYGKWYPVK
jgi:hypothetical protein